MVGVLNLEDIGYVNIYNREVSFSESIMHEPLIVNMFASLEEVTKLMIEKQQDHIFVVDLEERLVGIISGIDVVKKILDLISQ